MQCAGSLKNNKLLILRKFLRALFKLHFNNSILIIIHWVGSNFMILCYWYISLVLHNTTDQHFRPVLNIVNPLVIFFVGFCLKSKMKNPAFRMSLYINDVISLNYRPGIFSNFFRHQPHELSSLHRFSVSSRCRVQTLHLQKVQISSTFIFRWPALTDTFIWQTSVSIFLTL